MIRYSPGDCVFQVSKYPLKAKKNDSKNEAIAVTVVSCPHDSDQSDAGDSASWLYLMSRRPAGGLLAGQWEFLHTKVRSMLLLLRLLQLDNLQPL